MSTDRQVAFTAAMLSGEGKMVLAAEMGNLLLGDKVAFTVATADQLLTIVDRFFYEEQPGKGGVLGIGGSEGKRNYQPLRLPFNDPNMKKELKILVSGTPTPTSFQNIEATETSCLVRESGRISLVITVHYASITAPGRNINTRDPKAPGQPGGLICKITR